eukprot:6183315-Pleurochrysis_carterae.AAC.1
MGLGRPSTAVKWHKAGHKTCAWCKQMGCKQHDFVDFSAPFCTLAGHVSRKVVASYYIQDQYLGEWLLLPGQVQTWHTAKVGTNPKPSPVLLARRKTGRVPVTHIDRRVS